MNAIITEARNVKAGDVILAGATFNPAIVYANTVTAAREYDEMMYIELGDWEIPYGLNEKVSVVRA